MRETGATEVVTPPDTLAVSLQSDLAPVVAYFSMEIALEPEVRTYAGGLGILAGDTLRAAADLGIPMVGVSLLYRKGYLHQVLDAAGNQAESAAEWSPQDRLEPLEVPVRVTIGGRELNIRAWRYTIRGQSQVEVPVYLLDADVEGNAPADRRLTDSLYGGDRPYRLTQEAILGFGGAELLKRLELDVHTYHINEGQSALIALALLERQCGPEAPGPYDDASVRRQCVFTTHTPVAAGHDRFPMDMVREFLGARRADLACASGACEGDLLNMTHLGLQLSRYVNGVAMRHGQISRGMYPDHRLDAITNGVHAGTWTSPPFQTLFDRHLPSWRREAADLRHAIAIPVRDIREAHGEVKRALLDEVRNRTGASLRPDAFTIGFARRATTYKRATLLFTDLERLRRISREAGAVQVIYAGKAHPHDTAGKAMIRRVFEAAAALGEDVQVVYLPNYDMSLARQLCAGVDLWLNTPQKPQEASGTSGMKAALNGVPSLSVLDGWWIEGHVEGVTGWSIGESWEHEVDEAAEADSLYAKLERKIVPLYFGRPDDWGTVMRSAIALNGSFFNAERMLHQYVSKAYGLFRHR